MSIFSRFRDIIHSNLNAMLDKAEDPEKLIKLMIQEMEDTLVEIKASCAGAMASRAKLERVVADSRNRAEKWDRNARLALKKGREDLAREALLEKRAAEEDCRLREDELKHFDALIRQYQGDISQLEEKLEGARQKHRLLLERHIAASRRTTAQTQIRKAESSDAFARFEAFETRIDRMEADAELVRGPRRNSDLEEAFKGLEQDEVLEAELNRIREEITAGEKSSKPESI